MNILDLLDSPHAQRLAVAVGAGMADYLVNRAERRLKPRGDQDQPKKPRSAVKKKRR